MPQENYCADIDLLLQAALHGTQTEPLESYLIARAGLPGPRLNLTLLDSFADNVGKVITQANPPVDRLEALLDGWAAHDTPVNEPRVVLPCAAVLSYGEAGASRPDWWTDETTKLRRAAVDPRWRVREVVTLALQRLLRADWQRAYALLSEWVKDENPLVVRAAAAGIAEPPLLTDDKRGEQAVNIQSAAVDWLSNLPASRRREDDVRTLRKALGFTVSVAAAAAPDAGFALLERIAASDDDDLRWIVRENMKKSRLKSWPERIGTLQAAL